MKTLVVDDDKTLADILAFTFKREGYDVILAEDGSKALQLWEQEKPDFIILDVNIPKPDGFSVCRTIRKKEDTPIIFLTVRSDEEDIIHGLDLGADDYIIKPFSPRNLIARVEAISRRSKSMSKDNYREFKKREANIRRLEFRSRHDRPAPLIGLKSLLIDCLKLVGRMVRSEIIADRVEISTNPR